MKRSDLDDRMHLPKVSLNVMFTRRPKPHLIKKLSPDLRGACLLQITLIDLVLAKQTIPIVYSAGWAERRAVPAGVESLR